MPTHLTSISATFFTNLLSRLGVKPPPPDGFDLINIVQPVSLVDSDIVLPVTSSSITLDLPFTQGYVVNAGAGALLADSGPQAVGTYQIFATMGEDASSAAVCTLEIARRNAANNADIWSQIITCSNTSENYHTFIARVQLQANERIVIRNKVSLAATGQTLSANLWLIAG